MLNQLLKKLPDGTSGKILKNNPAKIKKLTYEYLKLL
tara:strand:+ start:410 stop:520 length:111 start_codon:yes stop_codon:yes gene_type:complete